MADINKLIKGTKTSPEIISVAVSANITEAKNLAPTVRNKLIEIITHKLSNKRIDIFITRSLFIITAHAQVIVAMIEIMFTAV